MRIIGDVHGKVEQYKKIVCKANHEGHKTLQLGDFGFKEHWDWLPRCKPRIEPQNHQIVMGNHDYTPYASVSPWSAGNFGYWEGIFYVRGAHSIDRGHRLEGRDWFADEELTYIQGRDAMDQYMKLLPDVVVTHDCPQVIMQTLFGYSEKSNNRMLFEAMWEAHKPKLWLFGHHHQSKDINVLGTNFRCLNELEVFEI